MNAPFFRTTDPDVSLEATCEAAIALHEKLVRQGGEATSYARDIRRIAFAAQAALDGCPDSAAEVREFVNDPILGHELYMDALALDETEAMQMVRSTFAMGGVL